MSTTATAGVSTSSGLAYWLVIVVGLLFLFHFVGFRAIFTAGKAVA